MAVSGCHLSCAESWVRDIGLIGKKDGWTVVIGGNVGAEPRIADEIASALSDTEVLKVVDKLVICYQENAKKRERLGKTIERIGIGPFVDAINRQSA